MDDLTTISQIPEDLKKRLEENILKIRTPLSEAQWAQNELNKLKFREMLFNEEIENGS